MSEAALSPVNTNNDRSTQRLQEAKSATELNGTLKRIRTEQNRTFEPMNLKLFKFQLSDLRASLSQPEPEHIAREARHAFEAHIIEKLTCVRAGR